VYNSTGLFSDLALMLFLSSLNFVTTLSSKLTFNLIKALSSFFMLASTWSSFPLRLATSAIAGFAFSVICMSAMFFPMVFAKNVVHEP